MLTDASQWEAARVHAEFFAAIRHATTFVEVQGFINREWLVEQHLHSSLAGRNKIIGLQIESAILLPPRLSSGEPE